MLFHAKRGIQEINYDALRNIKVLQQGVDENLRFILPPDYINYVRISVEKDGILFPLHENTKINYATEYLKDNNGDLLFDVNGEVLEAGMNIREIQVTELAAREEAVNNQQET